MKMATSSASTADNIDKMSQKIGISRQAYQELDFICSQSGTDVNKLSIGMKTLRSAMSNDKNADIFKALGVSVTDANGKLKSSEAVMWDTMNALQGITDQNEKAAIAQKLFGKTGVELMPLLNGQAGSIDEMKKKAHELGLVMSDELVDDGVKLTDSLDQTKRGFAAIVTKLGGALMPILTKVSNHVQKALPYIQKGIEQLQPIVSSFFGNMLPPLLQLGGTLFPLIMTAIQQLLPSFQQIATAILPLFISLIQQILPIVIQAATEVLPIIVQIIQQLLPFVIQIVEQVLPVFAELIQQLLPFLVQIAEAVLPVISEILQAVLPVLSEILKQILPILVSLLKMLLPPLLQIIKAVLPVILQLFKSIMPIITQLVKTILPILTQVLGVIFAAIKPILNLLSQLIQAVMPVLTPLLEGLAKLLSGVLGNAFKFIGNAVKNVVKVFKGVIDFIKGVFTGDWKKAWNGVVNIFKGIFNLIPGIIEFIINGAIKLINGLLSGIDWALQWAGVKIPKIPEVTLPRFRAGIDFVPTDKYPAYLDAGEAVLTASEAEKYRKAKRKNGGSPFKTEKTENKTINQTFNINVTVEKISDKLDIRRLAEDISVLLAEQIRDEEGVYA